MSAVYRKERVVTRQYREHRRRGEDGRCRLNKRNVDRARQNGNIAGTDATDHARGVVKVYRVKRDILALSRVPDRWLPVIPTRCRPGAEVALEALSTEELRGRGILGEHGEMTDAPMFPFRFTA